MLAPMVPSPMNPICMIGHLGMFSLLSSHPIALARWGPRDPGDPVAANPKVCIMVPLLNLADTGWPACAGHDKSAFDAALPRRGGAGATASARHRAARRSPRGRVSPPDSAA